MTNPREVALKILQVGNAGFTDQADGYKKLDECILLIDSITEQKTEEIKRLKTIIKNGIDKEDWE
jgi:hypothetical protein